MSVQTPYNLKNRRYSDKAAKIAMKTVYPKAFKRHPSDMVYETPSVEQDMYEGIDRIVKVPMLNGHLTFTVQERFRRPEVATYGDITISEWLGGSNEPSELYKTKADLLLWGLFDEKTNRMIERLLVPVAPMLHGLATGALPFKRGKNPAQDKYFICIKIDDLMEAGLLLYYKKLEIEEKAAGAA